MHVERHAPAVRQTMTPHPHLPPPLVMPSSSRLVAKFVAQFLVMHARPWARAVVIHVAQEVVGLVHQLAVARAARYVPPSLFLQC